MPGPDGMATGSLSRTPTAGTFAPQIDASVGAGMGGGSAGTSSEPPPPVFSGEPCEMGQSQACTCDDGVSQGTKVCRFDADSPTQGAFGPCDACMAPAAAGSGAAGTDGTSGTGASGAGASGTGASGTGASGTGASGTGASGTGASGTGGSGTGGSGGSDPPPDQCDPDMCDRPLLGEACCTRDGECGVRLLLSCN